MLGELSVLNRFQHKWMHKSPAIVKVMLRSHVSSCFWMGLPVPFCKRHLPTEDTTMVLETERKEQYETKYLPRKTALSGGWRRFAMEKKLKAGDVIIFHLVESTKFKVYIIRTPSSIIGTEAISTKKLDAYLRNSVSASGSEQQTSVTSSGKTRNIDSRIAKESKTIKLPKVAVGFENITCFKDFNIVMEKLIKDHEVPKGVLNSYYELCCSQSAFLHDNLFEGIYPRWINSITPMTFTDILSGIVNIANALKTCKLSEFLDQFASWQKTLNVYEDLGMNVKFLCTRLHHLHNLAIDSDGALDRKRYIEASSEWVRTEDKVRKLKIVFLELTKMSVKLTLKVERLEIKASLKEFITTQSHLAFLNDEIRKLKVLLDDFGLFFSNYDAIIEDLMSKAEDHEFKFQEEVSIPW